MRQPSAKDLKKLIEIADRLRLNNGCQISEIISPLGITRKELERALTSLSLCGLPPYDPGDLIDAYIENNRVYIWDSRGLFGSPARLSAREALSLFLAGRAVCESSSETEPELASALKKIARALKPDDASQVEQASSRISISPESGCLPLLNILKRASRRKKVQIEYFTPKKRSCSVRLIHPYGLIYYVDQWYCVGFCELRNEIRLFRVDRIKTAKESEEKFSAPEDFDLDEFRRERMLRMIEKPFKAKLRFDPCASTWAAGRWPGKTRISPDGSAVVSFDADSMEVFLPTALSLCASACIVSPGELKASIADAAEKTLIMYKR